MDSKRKKRIAWITVCGFILITGTYNALARFQFGRPQVIAAGIDPPLVETDKPKVGAKVVALIRPGPDPISRVELIFYQKSSTFFPGQVPPVVPTSVLDLFLTGDKLGKDLLYSVDIPIESRAAQRLNGLVLPLSWGNKEGNLAIRVTDKTGKTHLFPEIEFDLTAPAPYPTVPGYGAGYSVFQ